MRQKEWQNDAFGSEWRSRLGGQELIMASADDRVIPVILPLPHPGRAACGARESTQIDRCARHTHKPDRCAQCEEHKLIEFQVSVRFSDVVLPSESGSGDDCACSCTLHNVPWHTLQVHSAYAQTLKLCLWMTRLLRTLKAETDASWRVRCSFCFSIIIVCCHPFKSHPTLEESMLLSGAACNWSR